MASRYGCAYTGANREFYEPSKELMKRMAHYYDIPTSPWAFVFDVDMQVSSGACVPHATQRTQRSPEQRHRAVGGASWTVGAEAGVPGVPPSAPPSVAALAP